MSDYQAVYDAIRSRFHFDGDRLMRELSCMFDISHQKALAQEQVSIVSQEMTRPSVLYRPAIMIDGNKWCALYGADLQEGVAGFGDSPAEAMADFDRAWLETLENYRKPKPTDEIGAVASPASA